MPLVAVLGNGPVGQTAALMLARWGLPVVLLDQRAHRDAAGSKSIVQQRDVLDAWDAVGAGRRIADEGITWTTARTFYRDAELFSLTFADSGRSAFPPFVNISQSRTEQILDERRKGGPAGVGEGKAEQFGVPVERARGGPGDALGRDPPPGAHRLPRVEHVPLLDDGLRAGRVPVRALVEQRDRQPPAGQHERRGLPHRPVAQHRHDHWGQLWSSAQTSRSRWAVQIRGRSIPDSSSHSREVLNGMQCSKIGQRP